MNNIKEIKEKVKHLKVLFVDDQKEIRQGMRTFLKKFFDDVLVCSNGLEGLETFKLHKDIQVVITDILMPKMDGIEMIKKIKEIKQDIFIAYVSASRRDMKLDDNDKHIYLKKPISYDEIIDVMKSIGETL